MYKQAIAKIWGIPKSQVIRLGAGDWAIKSPRIPSGFKKIEVRLQGGSFWTLSPWGWVNLTEIAQNLVDTLDTLDTLNPLNVTYGNTINIL